MSASAWLEAEVDHYRSQDKIPLFDDFYHVLEALPTGVVVLNSVGHIQQSNQAANELLGMNLVGSAWMQIIQQCFAPRLDDGHEVSLKDGRRLSIQTRSLSDGLGQLIVLHDLTETRLLQEKIERHRRLLELGKMTASLAHQIRTPLSSAMLYASHLTGNELSEQQKIEFSKRIMDSLQHLEKQVKDMLLFARAEIPVNHSVSLQGFFAELEMTLLPILQKTHSHLHIAMNNPALKIQCNKEALLGAFINLVNNSIEAVGQSAQIGIQSMLNENQELIILVEDQGPGIAEELKNTIFQPFFSTKENGTGLGLAVVSSVAKAHQAQIQWSDSALRGAQFIWTFPASLLSEAA